MKNRLALVLIFFAPASYTTAAPLRHILRPTDSVFSAQTQQACLTYREQNYGHWCNPALFAYANDSGIKADLALSADEEAYETTDSLLNKTINKEFLERLFREKSFQAFSGLIRLEATSSYLSLAYAPLYLVGAYQLSNPNLPEVTAVGVKGSQFQLTSAKVLHSHSNFEIAGGAALNIYDRTFFNVTANVLDLTVNDPESLIEKERKTGVDVDAGLTVSDILGRFPDLGLKLENAFTPQDSYLGEKLLLDPNPNFRRKTRVGSGYTYKHFSGSYHLGIQVPFWDFFRKPDRNGYSLSFIYGLGRLRALSSFSPLMFAFGFIFTSAHYQVGIQYTNDKQDNSIELKRRKSVYLFTSFNF